MTTMKRLIQFSLALGFCAVSAAQAFCGFYAGKADASLFNEASQVIVARDGQRTVISMLNDYAGPLTEFALIVPTPTPLKAGQVKVAEKEIFTRLDAYSSPRLAEYHDSDPCRVELDWGMDHAVYDRREMVAMMAAVPAPAAAALRRNKALGVTVDAQYTLEEYDIVSLSAKQSDGLEIWLRENGYRIPQGAGAALKPYINQSMKFFVAKVNLKEHAKLGYSTLRPLQFAFESEKFMLPMRLGMLNAPPNKAQDLIVYTLTKNGRVESSNYRTVKLAANENLPPFVKPAFSKFYKALFDSSAKREQHRVVFTEYFWDMGWCDPCAADPLSPLELRKAGAFWVESNNNDSPAQPALLTRLHVRYTAATFPEDLLFTQTKDRQNWQTRYVIQNPFASDVAACAAKADALNCETICKDRMANVERVLERMRNTSRKPDSRYGNKPSEQLFGECSQACFVSKRDGLDAARRYYDETLPKRLAQEKQTLAQLTGWSASEIEALQSSAKLPTQKISQR
jgi:hypothetical protein